MVKLLFVSRRLFSEALRRGRASILPENTPFFSGNHSGNHSGKFKTRLENGYKEKRNLLCFKEIPLEYFF